MKGSKLAVAVLGDVGGQTKVYEEALCSIGVDPDKGILPKDLDLIQVGDVVRMNPSPHLDSRGCMEISDRLLRNNPGRFVQLLGNHDLALLGGAHDPHWKIEDLPISRFILEQWWSEKLPSLAVSLSSSVGDDDDILVTHAGMGYNYWKSVSGADALETAKALNARVGTNVPDWEVPGHLVTGVDNPDADTAWALVGAEFHATWIDREMPFNQIHGHACMLHWDTKEFWPGVPDTVKAMTTLNMEDRYTVTYRPDGRWVRSVDWILQNDPIDFEWPVLILPDHEITAS